MTHDSEAWEDYPRVDSWTPSFAEVRAATSGSPPPRLPQEGEIFDGRFRIETQLDAGGMGVLYRVRRVATGTVAALKLIKSSLYTDQVAIKRFLREIDATRRIDHPAVVKVEAAGMDLHGRMYLVLELLEGDLLTRLIRSTAPLSAERVATIGARIAAGLQAAHELGVVHRDLKADNVMVVDGAGDKVKVFDFGFVRLHSDIAASELTEPGTRVGTPLYMAPEYIRFNQTDARTDLYALGVILFDMASREVPFRGTPSEILAAKLGGPAPSLASVAPDAPSWLIKLVDQLLDRRPNRRPGSAEEVKNRLIRGLSEMTGFTTAHLCQELELAPARSRWPGLETVAPYAILAGAMGTIVGWLAVRGGF